MRYIGRFDLNLWQFYEVQKLSIPVVVHDGVKSVSNCEHSAVGKLGAYRGLYEVVRLQVNRCSSLVQHQNLGLA